MDTAHLAAALGLGLALGVMPGPVQVLLLTESARGVGRGIRAMAGANGTFGTRLSRRGGVILNPGAWIFLATTATALIADATRDGGRALAVLTSVALLPGVMVADGAVVAVGAGGRRSLRGRAWRWVVRMLSFALAALGLWLVARGLLP